MDSEDAIGFYHTNILFKPVHGRNKWFVASFLTAIMLLCTAPLYQTSDVRLNGFEPAESSGREDVHDGDWAVARQQTLNSGRCDSAFDYDFQSEHIVLVDCPTSVERYIQIYHNSDWNVVIETIDSNINFDVVEFSPNGRYLVAYGNLEFEIYQTSDWEKVHSGNVQSDGGTYYYGIYDIVWSGDGERILFVTGDDGGKMYEGPDWEEVTGTTSTGIYAAHHPSEDILWYLNADGTGNEYEFENIPFVGYQWVMKRSFTLTGGYVGPLSTDSDGSVLVSASEDGVSAYSTSDYSQEFISSSASGPVSFSSDSNFIAFKHMYDYVIYSTTDWNEISTIGGASEQCYYDEPMDIQFTADHGEMLIREEVCYSTYLKGWGPDDDSDGVANTKDICPFTSEDENADAKGCALSQKDTDMDGVNDRDDICPRTKTIDSADSNGCSQPQLQDSDGDGVSDSDDLCPSTPLIEFSNIYGCSSNQRDVDGDGVVDAQDNCPLYAVVTCPNILSWAMESTPMNGMVSSSLQWSPNGAHAVMQESESIALIDDTFGLVREHIFENESQNVIDFLWMPNSADLLIIWEGSSWRDTECGYYIWDTENDTFSLDYMASNSCSSLRYPTLSPDGTLLAVSKYSSSSYSGSTLVIDLITHETAFEDVDHNPRDLIFSHDGTSLVGLTSRALNLWDVNDGYLLQSKSLTGVDELLLSPDGDSLYAYSEEDIRVYSMDSFTFLSVLSFEQDSSYSASLSLSLEFSRSSELLYVMAVNVTYSGQYNYNSSMQTYYAGENGSLELVMPPKHINTSVGTPVFFPGQTSFYTYVSERNEYYEEGYYRWLPDADGDGIKDSLDLCPNTELNQFSSENGCSWEQLDDDEDGVSNGQDLCSGTNYQFLIDDNGCSDAQVDKDSDGICDQGALSSGPSQCQGVDLCPKTSPGNIPDVDGCSWEQQDEDEDEVPNGIDSCPETSSEERSNSEGCGEKQRDTDGDSLNDFWDLCPLTATNSSVDEFGCADLQVDSDLDSICDAGRPSTGPSNCTGSDTCPETSENETVNANGCSWDQQDEDSDGVTNSRDQCPGTVNSDISPDGCSSWQRDTDADGINDAVDECANTPTNEVANQVGCSQRQVGSGAVSSGDSALVSNWMVLVAITIGVLGLVGFFVSRRKEPELLASSVAPEYAMRGSMREDGKEWIEFPAGTGNQFYRDPATGQWVSNK